jgi:hypothetical protein
LVETTIKKRWDSSKKLPIFQFGTIPRLNYLYHLSFRTTVILKQEFLLETCNTGRELECLIKEFLNIFNKERPHLSLNMKTQNEIY